MILTQLAMDEQHSRSQRKFGAAPYCTASFLNKEGLICLMVSVDDAAVAASSVLTKAGKAAKSKAKVAHCEGMTTIVEMFKDSGSSLRHFCSDQATDACSDADVYFRPVWPGFRHNFDIWHKVKDFDSLWKAFCLRRLYARGVFVSIDYVFIFALFYLGPFAHKELQYLHASGRLLAYHFKIHFEYCCANCSDEEHDVRVERFKSIWLGAADHYVEKWTSKWQKKYLKTIQAGLLTTLVYRIFVFHVILFCYIVLLVTIRFKA